MRRLRLWWLIAERFCARLSEPIDVDRADREVEAIVRDSRLWRVAASWSAAIECAWLDSWARRVVLPKDFRL
jgi:hypothetical protein